MLYFVVYLLKNQWPFRSLKIQPQLSTVVDELILFCAFCDVLSEKHRNKLGRLTKSVFLPNLSNKIICWSNLSHV